MEAEEEAAEGDGKTIFLVFISMSETTTIANLRGDVELLPVRGDFLEFREPSEVKASDFGFSRETLQQWNLPITREDWKDYELQRLEELRKYLTKASQGDSDDFGLRQYLLDHFGAFEDLFLRLEPFTKSCLIPDCWGPVPAVYEARNRPEPLTIETYQDVTATFLPIRATNLADMADTDRGKTRLASLYKPFFNRSSGFFFEEWFGLYQNMQTGEEIKALRMLNTVVVLPPTLEARLSYLIGFFSLTPFSYVWALNLLSKFFQLNVNSFLMLVLPQRLILEMKESAVRRLNIKAVKNYVQALISLSNSPVALSDMSVVPIIVTSNGVSRMFLRDGFKKASFGAAFIGGKNGYVTTELEKQAKISLLIPEHILK